MCKIILPNVVQANVENEVYIDNNNEYDSSTDFNLYDIMDRSELIKIYNTKMDIEKLKQEIAIKERDIAIKERDLMEIENKQLLKYIKTTLISHRKKTC
ncbi:unnamed protein product [Rotaria sp. Silwood2]|nr:unnamed protein product [Rotaria sp. Silwood2]